ncbi:MAG: serine hydrolase [Candidatus Aminicenantes bacterium]|nr:MAG: serine hydrolase [Candidatus Aminicenantes bacterium]
MKLRRISFSILILLLFLSGTQFGQTQEELLNKVDAYVKKAMEEWEAPSVAISIVKDDSVVFARGYGVREIGKSSPADEYTLYAIGSSSKAFTAALVGMLIDKGKLKWDDRAIDYLPNLQLIDPWMTRELRIRDLMSHRIGLERADMLWGGTDFSRDEILGRLRYIEPVTSFRYRYGYNNNMFLAAGQIAAALSGKSWDELIEEHIFEPLGMSMSNTSTLKLKDTENAATPHSYNDAKVTPIPWRNIDNIGPAGSINSNVMEMAQWMRLHLGKGTYEGKKLLKASSIKEMHSPQTVIPKGKWLSSLSPVNHQMVPESNFFLYGFGWFLQDYHGRKIVQHGGSIDGMRCLVGMIPEENLGVTILTNVNPTSLNEALMFKVFDIFLGTEKRDWSAEMLAGAGKIWERFRAMQKKREKARVEGTKPSLALEKYVGTFENKAYGKTKVSMENGKLVMQVGKFKGTLSHWHYDTFQLTIQAPGSPSLMVTFTLNAAGKVDELRVQGLGVFK